MWSKGEVSTLVEGSKLDEDVRSVSVQCNQVKTATKIGCVDPRHGKSVASSCQLEPEEHKPLTYPYPRPASVPRPVCNPLLVISPKSPLAFPLSGPSSTAPATPPTY